MAAISIEGKLHILRLQIFERLTLFGIRRAARWLLRTLSMMSQLAEVRRSHRVTAMMPKSSRQRAGFVAQMPPVPNRQGRLFHFFIDCEGDFLASDSGHQETTWWIPKPLSGPASGGLVEPPSGFLSSGQYLTYTKSGITPPSSQMYSVNKIC